MDSKDRLRKGLKDSMQCEVQGRNKKKMQTRKPGFAEKIDGDGGL